MPHFRASFLLPLLAAVASAQTITTFAGTDFVFPVLPLPALRVPLGSVPSVAVDAAGNYYIADLNNFRVQKVDPSGNLTTVAGNGIPGFSGDNQPATQASISGAYGLALDSAGNLYIADSNNNRIRKVDTQGIMTTVAGSNGQGFSGDGGLATSASLMLPEAVAVDGAGNLYISDTYNQRVRKVTTAGIIGTIAGNGIFGYSGDNGPAISASLSYPMGLAIDASGNLFIADDVNFAVREVNTSGNIATVAGPATNAGLSYPTSVKLDAQGNLYIADSGNHVIRKLSNGILTVVAGNGIQGYSGDAGSPTSATLNLPGDLAIDSSGNLFIADTGNSRVRKVSAGAIATVAGNGGYLYAGDGGPASGAVFNFPTGVAADSLGNIYIADYFGQRIRMVNPQGTVQTVAGNGLRGPLSAGVPATNAYLYDPQSVAADTAGNLIVADTDHYVVRSVTPAGIITTAAGNGFPSDYGDGGPATKATLNPPPGVAVDASGNLFITDSDACVVRQVTLGIINTVAGSQGCGYSGDGGPPTKAQLNYPTSVAVDSQGNLYIADTANNVVRKVSGGTISTFAGNGACTYTGDHGPAAQASLCFPWGVALDAAGLLFIADMGNAAIREVSAKGVISTVAGNGIGGYSGDGGPATSASIAVQGIALDSACNLYLADPSHKRIRKVTGLDLTVSPTSVFLDSTAQAGPTVTIAAAAPTCPWTASSDMSWLSILSGSSGAGSGTVTFSVPANTTGAVRSATLTVGGHALPVTQRETAEVFTDVTPSDYYFDFANTMDADHITSGCSVNPPDYCPDSTTTRGQMAVFIITGMEGSNPFNYTTTPYFTDVPPSNPFFKFIQKMKDLGLTGGCTATTYCPDDPVTRAQMAVFVIAARYGAIAFTYPSAPYFADVPASSVYFPFVQKMAQDGITSGCGGGLYCPNDSLTRGQMAVFVVTGLLNQLLPASTPVIAQAVPNTGSAGQSVTVTLTGVNTHFAQGITKVTTPSGIVPGLVTVTSPTTLTVQLNISAAAWSSTGATNGSPYSLVVTSASEEADLPNGFLVR